MSGTRGQDHSGAIAGQAGRRGSLIGTNPLESPVAAAILLISALVYWAEVGMATAPSQSVAR